MQAAFIQEHAANPFGFDVAAFISSEAKRWGCPEAEISSVIDPLLPSVSGGKEWLLLEKAMTSVMIRLGFDESEHIGQKKAPRDGGYPDIRIKASTMQTSGFADTKATSRYGMDTNDTNKLYLYYKKSGRPKSELLERPFAFEPSGEKVRKPHPPSELTTQKR